MPSPRPRATVITCSDRVWRQEMEDASGPALRDLLESAGYRVSGIVVVPDEIEAISSAIVRAVDEDRCRLVVTTGGTGIAARDVTPEATDLVTEKKLPGFGELMRRRSIEKTMTAPLSRTQAAVRGAALVINVPGSRAGAVENLEAVIGLVPHALDLLAGETEHLK
jgi:molybdopterin adenylyltransferase